MKNRAQYHFVRQLARSWPPDGWREVPILIAVSGGADSVALLRGLVAIGAGGRGGISAAHVNHGLRGAESDGDEAFVHRLANQLGIACHRQKAELPKTSGDGLEAAARVARYEFLKAAAERAGARYVATAHTADDQAETILHRILRGTGLAGLAGIPRVRPLGSSISLIRPILAICRSDVLDYLHSLGQPYREDATNTETHFTRNRIRHELLPLIRQHYNCDADAALRRLGQLAGEAQEVIAAKVTPFVDRAVTIKADGSAIVDTATFADQPHYLVREILIATWQSAGFPQQSMGFEQWERLASMAEPSAADRKQILPGQITAKRQGPMLTIQKG